MYLSVVITVYLMWFFPSFYSRPLFVLPLLSILCLVFSERREASFIVIVAALYILMVFSLKETTENIGAEKTAVAAVSGRVVQDSQYKSGRRTGFRIMLRSAEDGTGGVYSAEGSVYVSSVPSDFFYGDMVRVHGHFSGSVFYGESAELVSRNRITSLRMRIVSAVKERLRAYGDAGELASLLVLGTGSDGSYDTALNARRSGLSHVLALSGMHLSIIAALLSPLLRRILGPLYGKALLFIVLFLFSWISGWRPSLVRALLFRLFLTFRFPLEESFALSLIALLLCLPESSADLGAAYSFISLGGIFLLSGRIDRSLRFFLPLPYSFSLSAAASIAAMLASIPMTLSIFGCYQMGAIITSFPLNAAITVYMVASILVLPFPFLSPLLELLYALIEKGFSLASQFPESETALPYLILVSSVFCTILLSFLLSRVAKR